MMGSEKGMMDKGHAFFVFCVPHHFGKDIDKMKLA